MNKNQPKISVVIATTAETTRETQINAAISSILNQQNCLFCIIVVINGTMFSSTVRQSFEINKNLQTHYLTEGSFPKALAYARSIITTEYFCFLDDDDELLPNSLASRCKILDENALADVVVGSGFKKFNENMEIETHPNITSYQECPLEVLYRPMGNWLASCAGMYRTSAIPQEYFDDYAVYAEWTYIAFKLALQKNVIFINELCYRVKVTPSSLSSNEKYLWGQYALVDKVLALPLPRWAKKLSAIKKREVEHDLAERFLIDNKIGKAWAFHLKSLKNTNTFFKYILYTRYFIMSGRI